MRIAFLLCAALCAACGGGADVIGAATQSPQAQQTGQQVVLSYDINNDQHPDTLTIDADGAIVEALESTGGADPVDTTDIRRGQRIDVRIADAVAAHVANTVALASRTQLDVVDSNGRTVSVTVYE